MLNPIECPLNPIPCSYSTASRNSGLIRIKTEHIVEPIEIKNQQIQSDGTLPIIGSADIHSDIPTSGPNMLVSHQPHVLMDEIPAFFIDGFS